MATILFGRTKPRQITERNRIKSPNAIELHPREAHVEGYCFGSTSVFRMAFRRFRSNASVRPKTSAQGCFGMRLRRINRPKAAIYTMNGVT